ncbi:MAG: hypothetical protein LRS48_04270 [Desulfurococcales archaeon]|nr:hypothetical protein [Desulfurococcales archaeon]
MSERIPAGGPYKAAVGLHESLNLEHIVEAKRVLSIYCSAGRDYCREIIGRLSEVSSLVARARIEDLSWNTEYSGLDAGILGIVRRITEFYAKYIAGFIATFGEDPLMIIRGVVQYGPTVLQEGEIARLPLEKAAALYAAGLAEPVEATAIKVGKQCIGGWREEE